MININNNYNEINNILSSNYDNINGYDFYSYIFPNNENSNEYNSDYSKPNAIYLVYDKDNKVKRRIMLNDMFESDYIEYIECNKAVCSGLSYRGRANKLMNSQNMNALIFDLDNVGGEELNNLFFLMNKKHNEYRSVPKPTFIVNSGNGLHVYYVFKEPIALYPNIKLQLKALKYDLTEKMWNYKVTSKEKQIQYQSINQGFRMVGSTNEKYNCEIIAYKVGDKIDLEYLNSYARGEKNQVNINKPFLPTKYTKDYCKKNFPEWYQRVIIDKNYNAKKWDIKSKQGYALYNWWRRRVTEIKAGHRYFYMMCLVIYACKCDVPKKKLKEDLYEDFEILKDIEHTNALTHEDIESALEIYSKEYYNFTIKDIEYLTDLKIKRNRRNGRKQELHLQLARATRDILHKNWRDGNGRKSKEIEVINFIKDNKNMNVTSIAKALKISRPTVYKYLKQIKNQE